MNPIDVFSENRSTVALDLDALTDLARRSLHAEGVHAPAEMYLAFVDPGEIEVLNREHMGQDRPTDVLSFPIDLDEFDPGIDGLDHGDADEKGSRPPRLVGDVFVSPQIAAKAKAVTDEHSDWSLDDELALLVVHGVLHLVGHDHAEPDERSLMQSRESELLRRICGIEYVPGSELR